MCSCGDARLDKVGVLGDALSGKGFLRTGEGTGAEDAWALKVDKGGTAMFARDICFARA